MRKYIHRDLGRGIHVILITDHGFDREFRSRNDLAVHLPVDLRVSASEIYDHRVFCILGAHHSTLGCILFIRISEKICCLLCRILLTRRSRGFCFLTFAIRCYFFAASAGTDQKDTCHKNCCNRFSVHLFHFSIFSSFLRFSFSNTYLKMAFLNFAFV